MLGSKEKIIQPQARGGLPPAMLRRVRVYVESHMDENIDLDMLASTVGLSRYHFARSFKQSEGITPHAFLLKRRLESAQELLLHSTISLSEIALAVGFADQSHFTRRFRQWSGVSPGEFRKRQL
jgi:AraC family transcriptional regulator